MPPRLPEAIKTSSIIPSTAKGGAFCVREKMLSHIIIVWLCCSVADIVGLPLIQISHDDFGDDYPEMQEEVHLEDFFWTGSGDGPPDYLKKVHTGISKGKDVIVKTETVVATVYVDGNNEVDIPICLDCAPDDGGGGGGGSWGIDGAMPPLNYSGTDRRYWLLTVMSGFYSLKDNPMLEEKLARLYRLAFTRQQSKHLGINGAQQISGLSIAAGRDRREHTVRNLAEHTTEQNDYKSDIEVLDMAQSNSSYTQTNIQSPPLNNNYSELATSSEESEPEALFSTTETQLFTTISETSEDSTNLSAYVTIIPWELIQQNAKSEKQQSAAMLDSRLPAQLHPMLTLPRGDHVRVIIHNITQITEADVQKGTIGGLYDDDVNEKIDDRPVANQTELIYTVLVNGRPVLATTAAKDMRLVSETEVVGVIGKEIYMKAEPYLREPQATPLAPATRSGSVGFIDSIQNNPALVIVSSVAILLLMLLLIALLLMGRSSAKHTEDRTSSRNELVSASQSGRPTSSGTALETGRTTSHSQDVGVQNFSFESEHGQGARVARIHFPGPPERGSRRDSITSSENTSDSSVYCPINPPTADVQRMLDAKAATLFESHQRRLHKYDRAEGREDAVYTSVLSEKKREKARHKAKRRYLSENRVGSLETSPVQRGAHSSGDDVATDSMDGDGFRATYENFERNESYNAHNNYHRNKLLHQKKSFGDKKGYPGESVQRTEAINKEIIRALQPVERSSDTGSIGSFLSMASVKAFPKSALPEPLNRVLDPVFVTYYDNVDDSVPAGDQPISAKSSKAARKQRERKSSLDATTIATIESFPTPKAPLKSKRNASQSDTPDPGVVGPIVWERHKKHLSKSLDTDEPSHERQELDYSPIHDPATMRNHYEGLLEGALHMFASQDDLPMPLPTRDFTNHRKPTKRENRGSSAGLTSYLNKTYNFDQRPATAQPDKTPKSNQSTQPPSPTTSAWGGSVHGSHSPLIRPMSAGPFHRPESSHTGTFTKSTKYKSDISAAPIIEAIQTELLKYKDEGQ